LKFFRKVFYKNIKIYINVHHVCSIW
jgi:hypothetical protein